MVAWSFPPSPERAAPMMGGAAWGEVEAARRVLVPPDAPAALPRPCKARRLLNRLARELRRHGWRVERRYAETLPMLRVHFPRVAGLGESITIARGDGGWWYRSSTGALLAPCSDLELAVSRVMTSLDEWVTAAASWRADGA